MPSEISSHSYGRFNHILAIRPFDYYLSSFFYPNYSNEDKIKMFTELTTGDISRLPSRAFAKFDTAVQNMIMRAYNSIVGYY